MATPLVRAVEERFPEARVAVACRRYAAAIFENGGARRRLVVYGGDGVWARAAAVRRSRPPGGFDACLVAPPSFAAAVVAVASGAGRRIGYGGEARSALLTDALPRRDYRRGHLSRAYLALLERLSGETIAEIPLPAVAPPDGWRAAASRLCGDRSYCVLAPGATYGSAKMWPRLRYAELARRLAGAEGLASFVVGGAAERAEAERLASEAGAGARSLAGTLSLGELLAVLRGAAVVAGNDSGPVHAAAALGAPTVAVFGPTSVEWTAPRGTLECLERVSVEDVYRAVVSLLKGE
ncbi:MAG: glycosyltransferase family 9 protein [Candidatus Latescibacterota bacterium]|nr:MAG: glycosyltransferase family 9 protein [Candidatus Latescibacterota bacterium]